MSKKPKQAAPFPSRDDILKFIEESPGRVGKREIGRAFHLDADQKLRLKKILKSLKDDGLLAKGRALSTPGALPPVAVVLVTGIDRDGEVLARPQSWEGEGDPPTIYMAPEKRGQPALGPQDRVLARLTPLDDGTYQGRTIRRIGGAPTTIMGVYMVVEGQGRLRSTDRKAKDDFMVARADTLDAGPGDLVRAEVLPGRRLGLRQARIIERLSGGDGEASSVSLIAIHENDIPTEFCKQALDQADAAIAAPLARREDLRDLALVTIDGADARDFDDAVLAEPDPDKNNKGGWRIIVAIADVSWYVRPGDGLDRDAIARGNSVYFPDRVVPMLPEVLSNGWCSLNPREERPCLVAHMRIDAKGNLIGHRFSRALMRSQARLTYDQVQAARDGTPDDDTAPLGEVIDNLYGAYDALTLARRKRGVLELELPERRIVIGSDGQVERIEMRDRFDSHKLIEEFMIAANVAAAETLERKRQPCMYRIHDEPSLDKMEALRQFLASLAIPLARGQVVRAELFNRILARVRDTPNADMVNQVVLRSQAQAQYSPDNIGHFGLALRRYCHFTSPIRRYADLLVHRALVAGLGLGDGGLEKNQRDFANLGEVLSGLERRAAGAERNATDRFCALFLADKVGLVLPGRINGVTRFG
ncbi:MAG TPA: VacB/RNase II family 3'-5' exoribonuclease, partial [Rhodospirillales bacterium]|nr:VacB/RNase II family 3'-5' exoribonuclease [Rhodospirillales bacterium]